MILTKEQTEQLKEASRPLMKFLCENFHPHVKVIVDPTSAEFVEGLASVKTMEYVLD